MVSNSKQLVPHWIRQEVAASLNELDGTHKDTLVTSTAVMGPEGFDVTTYEQSENLNPDDYGPMMLAGYNAVAGSALGKLLQTVRAGIEGSPEIQEMEEEERWAAMRGMFDTAIRNFLQGMLMQAGSMLQEMAQLTEKQPGMETITGSQILGAWIRISQSPIKVNATGSENSIAWGVTPGDWGPNYFTPIEGTIRHGVYEINYHAGTYLQATYWDRNSEDADNLTHLSPPVTTDLSVVKQYCQEHSDRMLAKLETDDDGTTPTED